MDKNPGENLRKHYSLDRSWAFRRGACAHAWLKGRGAGAGQAVNLPHCWNRRDTFQEGTVYYQGPAAYRKMFDLPPETENPETELFLTSKGFYGKFAIWLNGRKLTESDGAYLGFDVQLPRRHLLDTANLLAIETDNRFFPTVLPGKDSPDFLLYGGLAGGLQLELRPRVRFSDSDLWIRSERPLSSKPVTSASIPVLNHSRLSRVLSIEWMISGPDGAVVAEHKSPSMEIPPGQEHLFHWATPLPEPHLWDLEHPHLYKLSARLCEGTAARDFVEKSFGIREARFDGRYGFYLNGRHCYLHGVNRHESMPGFGNALPDNLHVADAEIIKDLGFNLVRLSHYPQAPAFLDACDRLGIMVYAEIATWKSVRRGRWLKAAASQMERMIRRDRHHPSVILWGMGNESRSRKAYTVLSELAGDLDPDRPTIYAENHIRRALRRRTAKIPDVLGINYEIDAIDLISSKSRTGSVLVSECCNSPKARRGDPGAELDQLQRYREHLAKLEGHPPNAGYTLWCFADYPTMRKQRWHRFPGVVDAWRLAKPAAWYMKARLSAAPFLQMTADWRMGPPGEDRKVRLFTNAGRVLVRAGAWEELLAGEPWMDVEIPFTNAPLTATIHNAKGESIETVILPWSAPAAIVLATEFTGLGSSFETGGILIHVVDRQGRPVLDWKGDIAVHLEGPGQVRYPGMNETIPTASGIGRFFVSSLGESGSLLVSASHPDMKPANLEIPLSRHAPNRPEV